MPEALVSAVTIAKPQSFADLIALLCFLVAFLGYATRGKLWDKPDPYHHLWFERPQLKNDATHTITKATRNIAQKMEEAVSES